MSDLVDPHAHILLELLQNGDYVQGREPRLHCGRDLKLSESKIKRMMMILTDNNKIWIE